MQVNESPSSGLCLDAADVALVSVSGIRWVPLPGALPGVP